MITVIGGGLAGCEAAWQLAQAGVDVLLRESKPEVMSPAHSTPLLAASFRQALGIATGYWAIFVTVASEQFGTNLRGTVTTTAPNFVRGAVAPMSSAFLALKPHLGLMGSAAAVGAVALALGFLSLTGLDETFGKDLDYLEPGP